MNIQDLEKFGKPQSLDGFDVVTIHPMADELQLRKRLNISPEDCWSCGLYWLFQEEVYHLDVCCSRLVQRPPKLNCWIQDQPNDRVSFYAIVDAKYISSVEIIKVLKYLSRYLQNHDLKSLEPQTLTILNNDVLTIGDKNV